MPPVLQLSGIHKRFGTVTALGGVDFALEPGEVHALLGENGAGKTTLMRIGFGLVRPDQGSIAVGGVPARLNTPADARRLGLGMVHQHFTSIPAFTVAENVRLAGGWRGTPAKDAERVRHLGESMGFPLEPELEAGTLSAGLKQRLEVLKALAAEARILLLDEPTSVLSPLDGEELLRQLARLKAKGVSSVLITHKLREALTVADRVTVLRQGRVAFAGPVQGQTAESLAAYMLGEPVRATTPIRPAVETGAIVVRVDAVSVPRLEPSGTGLRSANLTLRAGELVGVAAVEGNGQRELFRAIAGLAHPAGGTLAVERPVSFVPEDRSAEALLEEFSLTENLVLSQGASAPWIRGPWVQWKRAAARTAELIGTYGVRASGAQAPAGSLSGGNQQRMLIAEALERKPMVLLAENPTRGLDLKAANEVMSRLAGAAASGVAVLVHLPDLDDLLGLVTRLVVLFEGRVVEVEPGSSRERVGQLMLGAERP
jgi:general nucleoside transport system ATP-binding protein